MSGLAGGSGGIEGIINSVTGGKSPTDMIPPDVLASLPASVPTDLSSVIGG